MLKRLFTITLLIIASIGTVARPADLTVSMMTEQVMSVDSDNAITARIGYYLGDENGGLEPFIGCVWFPKEEETPQVITIGAIQHLGDVFEDDSIVPILPELLMTIITEDAVISPYFGALCTINLLDRDAGLIEAIFGANVKLTPDANSSFVFETGYGSMFGDLSGRDDHELVTRLGFRISF